MLRAGLHADPDDEDALAAEAGALGPVGTLVCDAAAPFAAAGGGIEGSYFSGCAFALGAARPRTR